MDVILSFNLDLALFLIGCAVLTGMVVAGICRSGGRTAISRRMIGIVLLFSSLSVLLALGAGERERMRLIEMLSGITPTYVTVLNANGLRQITAQTPPDDPVYLKLIELQKQLLSANPAVADIYTIAKLPGGHCALIVDSETDYNGNGMIDHERERRTPIGEVFGDPTLQAMMDRALQGKGTFISDITTDRWGTWVSAIQPVRDSDGAVYAAVGVDFPAERWVQSILKVRVTSLLLGLCVNAVVLVAGFMMSRLRLEMKRTRDAELEAKSSENRLRIILDNEPECVLVLDRALQIIECNPAGTRLLKEPNKPLIGRPINDFVEPAQIAPLNEKLNRVLAGNPDAFEISFNTAGERTQPTWHDVHGVALRDASSRVTGMLLVARDITARKQAETERELLQAQLLEASRRAGMAEIATGVLHNVGNVLNSVNVSVNQISQQVSQMRLGSMARLIELIRSQHDLSAFIASDPRGQCLPAFLEELYACYLGDQKAITLELQQLSEGIAHMKEVVRMQQTCASQPSNVLSVVDPTQLMEEALRVSVVSMERHQLRITRDYEPQLTPAALDRHKILQILINLISNAKRATCDPTVADRHITLSIRHADRGDSIQFIVKDNGIGIEPANLQKLFRHGFTTHEGGHGFGLHSSANAAVEMSGSLRGVSEGPGSGATFILTLPYLKNIQAVAA